MGSFKNPTELIFFKNEKITLTVNKKNIQSNNNF